MENEQVVVEETTSTKEVAPEVETPKEETQEVPEVKDEEVVIPPPKKQTAQERINAVIRKQREWLESNLALAVWICVFVCCMCRKSWTT